MGRWPRVSHREGGALRPLGNAGATRGHLIPYLFCCTHWRGAEVGTLTLGSGTSHFDNRAETAGVVTNPRRCRSPGVETHSQPRSRPMTFIPESDHRRADLVVVGGGLA